MGLILEPVVSVNSHRKKMVCESRACTVQKSTTFSASGMAIIIRDHNWNLTAAADRFSSLT